MAKVTKISIRINKEEYEVNVKHEVDADSVLILPLRAFVGAEHFGATRNMNFSLAYSTESELRDLGIDL